MSAQHRRKRSFSGGRSTSFLLRLVVVIVAVAIAAENRSPLLVLLDLVVEVFCCSPGARLCKSGGSFGCTAGICDKAAFLAGRCGNAAVHRDRHSATCMSPTVLGISRRGHHWKRGRFVANPNPQFPISPETPGQVAKMEIGPEERIASDKHCRRGYHRCKRSDRAGPLVGVLVGRSLVPSAEFTGGLRMTEIEESPLRHRPR